MAPGGAGGAESGGGVVLVPGSRHRPHLHRRPGPAPAPASRHRGPVSWWRLRRAGGGLRICAWEVGAREGVGSLQLVARRAGRLRPTPYLGAARPVPWGRLITVVPGRKAFCVSALVDGAGGRGRRGI